jgi:superoxide dismutase, Fe-Mn family
MMYEKKDFKLALPGLSEKLLSNHISLYEGYVANSNKLLEAQKKMLDEGKGSTPEFAEITRRFGWEWNGIRLHELYFSNLGSKPLGEGPLKQLLAKGFGSFESWEKSFRSVGAIRGIGWAMLYADPKTKQLHNVWINEHDGGHLAGAIPLLIMDVFEHAFMIDYGTKRADYIDVFFKLINWEEVENRAKEADLI